MINTLRSLIALDSPIRVFYHFLRGFLAHHIYGDPARDMIVIGVTGSKGKSTTTNIIAQGLERAGKKVFMFSTVRYCIAGEWFENDMKMTSVDPFILNKLLVEAKRRGCEYAIIEVSSHALFYNRVYGIDFDVAVFTNLSQDHLDLHHTMENYADTKLRLFTGLVNGRRKKGVKKVSVINIDSEYAPRFLEATVDTLYSFGTLPNAQIRAQDIVTTKEGTSFTVRMPSGTFSINTKLCGEFNVWNILAAVGVLISQRVDSQTIKETMENLGTLPGRLQEVSTNFPFTVFVDYAHTEESLRNVLETIRSFKNVKRIITVFGATGDRDRDKRPKMGAMVHKLSDVIILTEDDNYTEDQFRIMNEVSKGIKRKEGEDFWIIFNREDAIRTALILAQKDDVVLLAGK
ncbi:MAG: UDP-N-acetylmuramoyl-L-alanyl-D-glutamate--2,6-diaminopimelate ligase [Patescibacteria group bacterium]